MHVRSDIPLKIPPPLVQVPEIVLTIKLEVRGHVAVRVLLLVCLTIAKVSEPVLGPIVRVFYMRQSAEPRVIGGREAYGSLPTAVRV